MRRIWQPGPVRRPALNEPRNEPAGAGEDGVKVSRAARQSMSSQIRISGRSRWASTSAQCAPWLLHAVPTVTLLLLGRAVPATSRQLLAVRLPRGCLAAVSRLGGRLGARLSRRRETAARAAASASPP
jgi:hypothetical protein